MKLVGAGKHALAQLLGKPLLVPVADVFLDLVDPVEGSSQCLERRRPKTTLDSKVSRIWKSTPRLVRSSICARSVARQKISASGKPSRTRSMALPITLSFSMHMATNVALPAPAAARTSARVHRRNRPCSPACGRRRSVRPVVDGGDLKPFGCQELGHHHAETARSRSPARSELPLRMFRSTGFQHPCLDPGRQPVQPETGNRRQQHGQDHNRIQLVDG